MPTVQDAADGWVSLKAHCFRLEQSQHIGRLRIHGYAATSVGRVSLWTGVNYLSLNMCPNPIIPPETTDFANLIPP